jgi:hypothetical protein
MNFIKWHKEGYALDKLIAVSLLFLTLLSTLFISNSLPPYLLSELIQITIVDG